MKPGRPRKFGPEERRKLRERTLKKPFKPEESTAIKPLLYDREVTPSEALELVHDPEYYQDVMEAGFDLMYAYRYLSWRLNCPHQPDHVKNLVKAQKPSPGTVFNLLADHLVEQFGSGIPDDNEDDWGAIYTKRILEEGRSWGAWPEAPRVGEWKSNQDDQDDSSSSDMADDIIPRSGDDNGDKGTQPSADEQPGTGPDNNNVSVNDHRPVPRPELARN